MYDQKDSEKPRNERERKTEQASTSKSPRKSKSGKKCKLFMQNIIQRCAKCCRRKKSKIKAYTKKTKSKIGDKKKKKGDGKEDIADVQSIASASKDTGPLEDTPKKKSKEKKKKKSKESIKSKKSKESIKSKKSKKSKETKKPKKGSKKSKDKEKEESTKAPEPSTDLPGQDEKIIKDIHDFTKTCCYLCAKNTMAIAAAAASNKVEKSDVHSQVSTHQLFKEPLMSDKSCSPTLYVRTVQSSVKVKTREICTLFPEEKTGKKEEKVKAKNKHKKFRVFPKVKKKKAEINKKKAEVRNVGCVTDLPTIKPLKPIKKVKCDAKGNCVIKSMKN